MGSIANVVLRGRIFHFRRRVPDDLRPGLRLDELVRSLATSDIRAAKLRACQLPQLRAAIETIAVGTDFSVLHTGAHG